MIKPQWIDSQDSVNAPKIGLVSYFVEHGISQIISVRTANTIFGRYCAELSANFPAAIIGPAESAPEVRSSKPVLFLAILAAASGGVCDVDTQKRLRCLLTIVLAHCFPKKSEYSLELVQASIVSALWHTPPDPSYGQEPMDMLQLSHAAANIAIHIGLSGESSTAVEDDPFRRYKQESQRSKTSQPADLEARRTWLGCYYICAK